MKSCIPAVLIMISSLLTPGCNANPQQVGAPDAQDRKPAFAGSFYPADKAELIKQLEKLFSCDSKSIEGEIRALIVPHAGYVFSGETAAAAYKQLNRNHVYDRIFLIGSSHTMHFRGASIFTQGNYVTPLGRVRIDPLAAKLVADHDVFIDDPLPHQKEHSLEVQLPFLQYWLKQDFSLVPIVLGGENRNNFEEIAEILKPWFNESNLFVISSDFSHYPSAEDAESCDAEMANAIIQNSVKAFLRTRQKVESRNVNGLVTAICGWTSVYTLLSITENIQTVNYEHIDYRNSGDSKYGSDDRVVGYHSIAVVVYKEKSQEDEFTISDKEKKELLKMARQTLKSYIPGGTYPIIIEDNLTASMNTPAGAFVTLKKQGQLRGCIGSFQASTPLYKTVQQMTVAAATNDYRFPKVRAEEIDELEIEISVLTPMQKIKDISEIELGRHGIYLRKGNQTGTFLPQVATETGWSLQEFLGHCARDKAGIGWEGWKTSDIYIYEALVFSEYEFDLK